MRTATIVALAASVIQMSAGQQENVDESHVSGGLPTISDALFSLVVLIYVSIAFLFVFFMFCWKSEADLKGKNGKGGGRHCVLMTNSVSRGGGIVMPTTETHVSQQCVDMTCMEKLFWPFRSFHPRRRIADRGRKQWKWPRKTVAATTTEIRRWPLS